MRKIFFYSKESQPKTLFALHEGILAPCEGWHKEEAPQNGFHLTASFTMEASDCTGIIKMMEMIDRKQKTERKRMLWYVTHGYNIAIKVKAIYGDTIEHDELLLIDRPKALKLLLRKLRFIPEWDTVPKRCLPYRPNPDWKPLFGEELAERIKKILKKYDKT